MKLEEHDVAELTTLEESLWKRETRFDEVYMRSIMDEDSFEFGRSGKIYNLEQLLSAPEQDINAVFPLKELAFHSIAENVVLVTYISQVQYEVLEIGNRSSLWVKKDKGWRLRFHQGTPA